MPQPYSASLRAGNTSKPAATSRQMSIPPTSVISNEGASSSRDRTKFEFRFSDESSPPHEPTSPTKAEQSILSTSNISVYSDTDDQSKSSLHTSEEEQASEAAAWRAVTAPTPGPPPTHDSQLHARPPSPPVEADLPHSKSKPGWRSSLRISLASFMSRLFTSSKKKIHGYTLSEAQEGDKKESERMDRLAARTALLPLR